MLLRIWNIIGNNPDLSSESNRQSNSPVYQCSIEHMSLVLSFFTQAHAMRLCSVSLKFFNFFLSTTLSNVSTKCLNQFWWNLVIMKWPMTKRADVQWPLIRSKVIQGQRGQKSIFSPKRIKSTRFHGMFTILIHMIAYNALYKSYRIKNSSGVIWGHRGQKVIRIQKIFKKSYLLGAI